MLRLRPSGWRGLSALAPPQKKDAGGKKLYEDKGKPSAADEGPLDDPVAEKLRQQKCAPGDRGEAPPDMHAALQRRGGLARCPCSLWARALRLTS